MKKFMDEDRATATLVAGPETIRARGSSRVACVLAATALVHPLAYLTARWDWRLDLLTHFREPAMAVALVALVVAMARRRIGLAAGLMALALVQLGGLLTFEGSNPVPASGPGRLRIVVANVLHSNTNYEALADLVRRERPDVLGLVEFSEEWREGLSRLGLRDEFPTRVERPAKGHGIALWLRRTPSAPPTIEVLSSHGNPAVRAVIEFDDRPLTLWLMHPPNPIDRRARHRANGELLALGERIGRESGARLVVGDLNRTEGSPFFAEFLRLCGLRDSRLGFGLQPSWPTWSSYRIAIDHAFASREVAIVDRRLGPFIGSDHFPLVLDVAPAAIASHSAATSGARPSHRVSATPGEFEANLSRSAASRRSVSRRIKVGPTASAIAPSARISSVVAAASFGPKPAINAARTDSDQAINSDFASGEVGGSERSPGCLLHRR